MGFSFAANGPPMQTQPRPMKKRIFRLLCLALPLLLLLGAEWACRLAGFGGYPPVFRRIGDTPKGALYITDTTGPAAYFPFLADHISPNDQYAFFMPKPTNTVRVMIAGESAAKGFPQSRAFASSAFLQAMLQDVWPDRDIEVINLGCTAVASYPVMRIVREAVDYQPDMLVIYAGHNEFYGTYGVASSLKLGSTTRMLDLQYALRSFALVQAITKWTRPEAQMQKKRLMELMAGQPVPPEDPLRAAAARNLHHHVTAMIAAAAEKNIPVLVCRIPSQERDLHPLGCIPGSTEKASVHYAAGKTQLAAGRHKEALQEFIAARDMDPLPWRATTELQDAALRAAREKGAVICDVEALFREYSPDGCLGWELLDDHVHPTLQGQALIARAVVKAMSDLDGELHVPADRWAALADWQDYAAKMGDNRFERYAVARDMMTLFEIPFLQSSNPGARERFERMVTRYRAEFQPEEVLGVKQWENSEAKSLGKKSISGFVAGSLMTAGRLQEALELLSVARRAVPAYSSWHISATYFWLACKEKLQGALLDEDKAVARETLAEGRVLMQFGHTDTGQTERFLGRLHQMLGEHVEALPLLHDAAEKLTGLDRVAVDQARITSLLMVGDTNQARAIIQDGIDHSGQYQVFYNNFLNGLPAK